MVLTLTALEIQELSAAILTGLLPRIDEALASQQSRHELKMLTLEEVATNAGVVRKTVERWVADGKLKARNWGTPSKPLYRVSVEDYWRFYDDYPVLTRKGSKPARGNSKVTR